MSTSICHTLIFIFVVVLSTSARRSAGIEKDGEYISIVNDFIQNDSLGRDLSVIVIVKDFTQMFRTLSMRERMGARRGVTKPPKFGRMEVRDLEKGVVFAIDLDRDRIDFLVEGPKWKKYTLSPSGVSFFDQRMLISGGKKVFEIDLEEKTQRVITNDWFRHLHTVRFNNDGTKFLTSSTGMEIVIEYDLEEDRITWEWCSMDHGYNVSEDGKRYMTRNPDSYEEIVEVVQDIRQVLLVDPRMPAFSLNGIANGRRFCHINGAFYIDDDETQVGMTFGQRGEALTITKNENHDLPAQVVYDKLAFPHSFYTQKREYPCKGFIIANTRNGTINFLDSNFRACLVLSVTGLPTEWVTGDDHPLEKVGIDSSKFEWTQYATHLKDDLYSIVDVKRRNIVIVDIVKREYRLLPYDHELSVQEVRLEPVELYEKLRVFFREERELRMKRNRENFVSKTEFPETIYSNNEIAMKNIFTRIPKNRQIVTYPFEVDWIHQICEGKFLPHLDGFMNEEEVDCVLGQGTLCDGTAEWEGQQGGTGIGLVVKSITKREKQILRPGDEILLVTTTTTSRNRRRKKNKNVPLALMTVESTFDHDRHMHSYHVHGKSFKVVNEEAEGYEDIELYHDNPEIRTIFKEMQDYFVSGRITHCFSKKQTLT